MMAIFQQIQQHQKSKERKRARKAITNQAGAVIASSRKAVAADTAAVKKRRRSRYDGLAAEVRSVVVLFRRPARRSQWRQNPFRSGPAKTNSSPLCQTPPTRPHHHRAAASSR